VVRTCITQLLDSKHLPFQIFFPDMSVLVMWTDSWPVNAFTQTGGEHVTRYIIFASFYMRLFSLRMFFVSGLIMFCAK